MLRIAPGLGCTAVQAGSAAGFSKDPNGLSSEPTAEKPVHSGKQRPRIIVVDDDPAIRESLENLLQDEGYETETCGDGLEALESLRQRGADLVILDLRMPLMSGWEFRATQRRDSRIAGVPVLAVSADDSPQARAIHADAYLAKPLDADTLLSTVARLLEQQAQKVMAARLAEAERLAALGRLAAGVGHEINNPLTYVIINLRLASSLLAEIDPHLVVDEPVIAKVTAMMTDSLDGLERIAAIVASLQGLARHTEGERTLVDVSRILDRALTIAEHETRARAQVARSYRDRVALEADEGRLLQLFVNLIVNAAQAIKPGAPQDNTIEVTTMVRQGRLHVAVRDTGQGIPEDVLPHVFNPFFTTKQEEQGTGLGLAISQEIAREHGGDIVVETRAGMGTAITVRLPLSGRGLKASHAEDRPQPTPSIEGGRVLVVDDEPQILRILKRSLEPACSVSTAPDVAVALEIIENDAPFDVILCDIVLPTGGVRMLRTWLEQRAPELLPGLVYMTGGGLSPETQSMLDESPNPVLRKPFHLDEVHQTIAAIMARRVKLN